MNHFGSKPLAGNVKGACHERGLLQALRRYGSCEEWNCAWLSTLSLPLVRLQFHNDSAAWQAACDEGAGVASLRHGQRQLWLHSAHSRRQRRGGSELGPRREGYHRLIPDDQLFTGKDLTVPIEQNNSNIRHFLARFRRRTKVVSKVVEMVDLSLRIYHHFHDNLDAFAEKAAVFRAIFS